MSAADEKLRRQATAILELRVEVEDLSRQRDALHEHLSTALSACKAWQLLYEHMRERDANR